MKFTRLRLSGFKSFVEPTELYVEPGLTAVIGPNGCGKSNLFDALRWVMGETRPSSIRGSEMDDVIFAGSSGRPARNVAEVTIFIDNSDHTAGAPYTDSDTIEISRRIEREAGSVAERSRARRGYPAVGEPTASDTGHRGDAAAPENAGRTMTARPRPQASAGRASSN